MKKWRVMEHEAGCGQSYFHVEEREPWFMFFAWNFRRSFSTLTEAEQYISRRIAEANKPLPKEVYSV